MDVDGDRKLQPELARRCGLEIENIHTPYQGINSIWQDNIDGMDFEKKLIDCLVDCSEFGILAAVVHISQTMSPPPANDIGLERIKRLVDKAEVLNINIALENLRRPDYLDFVFDSINSERLGFCYDSGHENCYSKGTDLFVKYGSKLKALHLHDNDGSDDQHMLPGEGSVDWETFALKLCRIGYSGNITLEVRNEFSKAEGKDDPVSFLKNAYKSVEDVVLRINNK